MESIDFLAVLKAYRIPALYGDTEIKDEQLKPKFGLWFEDSNHEKGKDIALRMLFCEMGDEIRQNDKTDFKLI